MKILLPVDGSDFTKRMVSYLAAHDELLGASHAYTVLTVISKVPLNATRFVARETIDDYYAEEAEAVLKPIRSFADQQGWTMQTAHRVGRAADEIALFAEQEGIDLIVMGTHGHSMLGNVVLGSVVSGVLARCRIPVLLVR